MKVFKIDHRDTGLKYEIISLDSTLTDIEEAIKHAKETDVIHFIIQFNNQSDINFPIDLLNKLTELFGEIESNPRIKSVSANIDRPPFNLDIIKRILTPSLLKKIVCSICSGNNLKGISIASDFESFGNNEEIFNYLLSTQSLRDVLIEAHPNKQIFHGSCSAHSIMKHLHRRNAANRYSVLTEMEIYQAIWRAPGEVSDPAKIKKYLESCGVELYLIEDVSLVKQAIGDSINGQALYEYTRTLFDQAHYNDTGINESTFPHNSGLLIVIGMGQHMIIAERLEDGKIILQDTYNSIEKVFDSVELFNNDRHEKAEFSITATTVPSTIGFSGLAFRFFYNNEQTNQTRQNPYGMEQQADQKTKNI